MSLSMSSRPAALESALQVHCGKSWTEKLWNREFNGFFCSKHELGLQFSFENTSACEELTSQTDDFEKTREKLSPREFSIETLVPLETLSKLPRHGGSSRSNDQILPQNVIDL